MNINKKSLITVSDGLVGSALKKLLGQGHIFHEIKNKIVYDFTRF
jgi:hypothetical protein